MAKNDLIEQLRQLHFSANLADDVLGEIAQAAQEVQLTAGQHVFREGSKSDRLYVVRQGRVALDINVPGRGATRILTLGPGDMFGWSALLGTGPMVASAVAIDDTDAIAISGAALRAVCEANHDVGYQLMRRMAVALSRRLVATRLQLLDLFHDNAPEIETDVEPAT